MTPPHDSPLSSHLTAAMAPPGDKALAHSSPAEMEFQPPKDPPAAMVLSRFFRNGSPDVASPSERLVLDLVRRSGTMSRADLTRACGLSSPGAKALIDSLVARGLLQLGPPA